MAQNPAWRFRDEKSGTAEEMDYQQQMDAYIGTSVGSDFEKMINFTKYVPRQFLTRFLTRYEIFKQVLNVQGSVVECGVLFGRGVMTFAQLSAIFEPANHQRKVIGFDTFSGFPELHEADQGVSIPNRHPGGMAVDAYDDLNESIRLFDMNRHVGHIPMVQLVRGDVKDTIPQYLEENPHTVVSLLHLDIDLYEPTKIALESFLPRMPKGAVIVFDELNAKNWPGETTAVMETVGIQNLRIQRFPYDSFVSYAIIE
jgi:hypothetical protein